MSLISNAVEIIKGEGFSGPHCFVLLTRYAALTGDRALLKLVGNTLEDMSTMEPTAMLAYAYAEYFQAMGGQAPEFPPAAADYILSSCDRDDRALALAYVKCARVFSREDYLEQCLKLLADEELMAQGGAFSALAFIELYRATFNESYLDAAVSMADVIEEHFSSMFSPEDAYDLEYPSMNSAVSLLYDELARMLQSEKWISASGKQKVFIKKLADKYSSKVAFGLISLLDEEFAPQTIVCAVKGESIPKELLSIIAFYSPLTEILVCSEGDSGGKNTCRQQILKYPAYYFLKNGCLEEIKGL